MIDRTTASARPRLAFTAIELAVVIAVAAVLASLTIVGIVPALRRGRVAEAVGVLQQACADARHEARARWKPTATVLGDCVTVRLSGDTSPNEVTVLVAGVELVRRRLPKQVQVFRGDQPLAGDLEWAYQYGTGWPWDPANGRRRAIGAGAKGTPEHLSLRTLDSQVRMAVAIYDIGAFSAQEF